MSRLIVSLICYHSFATYLSRGHLSRNPASSSDCLFLVSFIPSVILRSALSHPVFYPFVCLRIFRHRIVVQFAQERIFRTIQQEIVNLFLFPSRRLLLDVELSVFLLFFFFLYFLLFSTFRLRIPYNPPMANWIRDATFTRLCLGCAKLQLDSTE